MGWEGYICWTFRLEKEILRIERCGKDFPTCGFVACSFSCSALGEIILCIWWDYFVHISCFATGASHTCREECRTRDSRQPMLLYITFSHARNLRTQWIWRMCSVHSVYSNRGIISAQEGIRGREAENYFITGGGWFVLWETWWEFDAWSWSWWERWGGDKSKNCTVKEIVTGVEEGPKKAKNGEQCWLGQQSDRYWGAEKWEIVSKPDLDCRERPVVEHVISQGTNTICNLDKYMFKTWR